MVLSGWSATTVPSDESRTTVPSDAVRRICPAEMCMSAVTGVQVLPSSELTSTTPSTVFTCGGTSRNGITRPAAGRGRAKHVSDTMRVTTNPTGTPLLSNARFMRSPCLTPCASSP